MPDRPYPIPFSRLWTTPFGLPPFDRHRRRPISARPSRPPFAEHAGEIAAIAAEHGGRPSTTRRGALERSGRTLEAGLARPSSISPARTPTTELQAIEREIAPRPCRAPQHHLHERAAVRSSATRSTTDAVASVSMPSRSAFSTATTRSSCARAHGSTPTARRGSRRFWSVSRRSAPRSPERARRRARLRRSCSRTSEDLAGLARFRAGGRGPAPRRSADSPAST